MTLTQARLAAREIRGAILATIHTRRRDALVRRVRRLAPYAVRAATPAVDPAWEARRTAFCGAAAAYGGAIDAASSIEIWAYFADAASAACVRAAARAHGLEVAAWDTRQNPARPYFATYVDGYGPR